LEKIIDDYIIVLRNGHRISSLLGDRASAGENRIKANGLRFSL